MRELVGGVSEKNNLKMINLVIPSLSFRKIEFMSNLKNVIYDFKLILARFDRCCCILLRSPRVVCGNIKLHPSIRSRWNEKLKLTGKWRFHGFNHHTFDVIYTNEFHLISMPSEWYLKLIKNIEKAFSFKLNRQIMW